MCIVKLDNESRKIVSWYRWKALLKKKYWKTVILIDTIESRPLLKDRRVGFQTEWDGVASIDSFSDEKIPFRFYFTFYLPFPFPIKNIPSLSFPNNFTVITFSPTEPFIIIWAISTFHFAKEKFVTVTKFEGFTLLKSLEALHCNRIILHAN